MPAQYRMNPNSEVLDEVVISAGMQPEDPLFDLATGGNDDNRNGARRPNRAANLSSVDIGQTEICE